MKRQILVVDNDPTVCQTIHDSMQDELTNVCCKASAVEALANYIKQEYCLVILEVQLSDMDNMKLLQTMRQTKHTPILVLSKSLTSEDKIALFHAGADACIEKPIIPEVCIAQAKALIQLYINADINHEQHGPVIHGEELIISPRYRQVIVDGKLLQLTRKEFDLLYHLAKSPGQIFTREQLYDHIWSDSSIIAVDEAVRAQIKRLRRKLSSVDKNYIQTEWGVGYKFILPNSET